MQGIHARLASACAHLPPSPSIVVSVHLAISSRLLTYPTASHWCCGLLNIRFSFVVTGSNPFKSNPCFCGEMILAEATGCDDDAGDAFCDLFATAMATSVATRLDSPFFASRTCDAHITESTSG